MEEAALPCVDVFTVCTSEYAFSVRDVLRFDLYSSRVGCMLLIESQGLIVDDLSLSHDEVVEWESTEGSDFVRGSSQGIEEEGFSFLSLRGREDSRKGKGFSSFSFPHWSATTAA